MKSARWLQYAAGIVIGGTGIFVFLRGIDIRMLLQHLSGIPLLSVLGSCALFLVSLKLRELRWRVILSAKDGRYTPSLYRVTVVGYMLNNIFPARMGEAARMLLLWKRGEYGLLRCIGSLFMERVLDGIVLVSLFVLGVVLVPVPDVYTGAAWGGGAVVAAVCVMLCAYRAGYPFVMRLHQFIQGKLPDVWARRYGKVEKEISENLYWLWSRQRTAHMVLLSFAVIFCYVIIVVLLVNRWPDYHLAHAMVTHFIGDIGAIIPLSPGYIGTVHAFLRMGLTATGVATQRAAAVAVVYHAAGYIPVTLLGLFYFSRMDVSFSVLSHAKESIQRLQRTREESSSLHKEEQ